MFYLFLIILSFIEFYFFRLLNQIFFRGASFTGDIIFAVFGIVISVLFLEGMIHVKHLNRKWLKKLSLIIVVLSILYFFASCLSFNFNYIISSLEISIILIVASFFLYRYQTAPEGEPDIEDNEIEEVDVYSNSFTYEEDSYINDTFDEFIDYEPFVEPYIDQNLLKLKNLIDSITEKFNSDEEKFLNTKNLIENVFEANSEYRDENIENIIYILTVYNDEVENQENSKIIEQIDNSINLINNNLENIYYNTRGAQVFRAEQEVKALKEGLEKFYN